MRSLLFLLLLACGDEPDVDAETGLFAEDTGFDEVDPDEADTPRCTDHEIKVLGPDAPAIGDSWRVSLTCGGAVELGPYVVRVTPIDLARIDGTQLTFARDGAGQVMVQVGSVRRYREVVVSR
jgi:hypothetical protein